ncbi:MAG: XRE family transcriptional regulator [Rhodanobacter sp.]|nr:MAG: XRE family transcriptional regulator [Rhodanobacter sp.]TAL93046.1 MAG: XRE family transcriptional regulator [Rhodanobacter sp.]TAM39822.1 MAG: XRE family transcriptional regulator [Rhodanobacter sp.]
MPSKSLQSFPSSTRSHIAANIRRRRKTKGLSQEKLGELAELHRTYVSQLERCKTNISIDSLERIARILGVDTAELLQPPPRGTAPLRPYGM